MKNVFLISALAIAAGATTGSLAQTITNSELDPIIVSGGISPVTADEFGRSNTIITRQQIEKRGYATVQDALEAQPGVSINGSGPNDRQIRIRGGEANQTLVLVDGVRVDAGITNGYNLRSLNLGSIDRIEILRGPQSVPFGTDASSGVVNIITREAGEGLSIGAQAEVGEGHRESGYLTLGQADNSLSVTASKLYDEGYDFSGDGGEKDSTRLETLTSKGKYALTNALSIGFNARVASGRNDFDDFDNAATGASGYIVDDPSKQNEVLERLGSLYLEGAMFDRTMMHRVRIDETSNQSSSVTDKQTELVKYRLQYAADGQSVDITDHRVSALIERKRDTERDSDNERENRSLALEYNGSISSRQNLQAGARYDDSDQFSDALSWNAATSYAVNNTIRLTGSVGRAVVYPTFTQTYGGTFFGAEYRGDRNLEPEENVGFDVGAEFTLPDDLGTLTLIYFNEQLENEIYADEIVDFLEYAYENRDRDSDREGIEFSAFVNLSSALTASVDYTLIDSETATGHVETRRPEHEVNLGVDYQLRELNTTLSADIRYVKDLYDGQFWTGGNSEGAKLPDFTVANLSAQHALTDRVELTARITNAFDKDYQEVWGYATRGRAGFIGLRAEF
ncbi:MAG: TonB-dependent receptor [Spiribacter sp.]|jgi:vitamin B12 transporter|nr:TonB-dependent receptor [Spiribacter sp.]MDR9488737.1 TonB-dependent receptor [Spiribacter sp.]